MARTNRQKIPSVKEVLFQAPYRFEFHQAVKLMEYLNPESSPFGETINPHEEVVTVKSRIYLESMSSDIYALDTPQSEPAVLTVNFMGVAGIQGPLPFPYTEMIIQRLRAGDHSLSDFLDIFNHRLATILHRIRKQYMISLNTVTPEKTEIAKGLKSILGLGERALQKRLHLPDRSLLEYSGLYSIHPRSAEGLETILKSYFHIPVSIEKCAGTWRKIEKSQQTKIGLQGQWTSLGKGAVLGTRVWDQQSHFRIHLGPLDVQKLDDLLPSGNGFQRLLELTRLYVDPSFDFSVSYEAKDPPATTLGAKSYLGWRTWLGEHLTQGDKARVEALPSTSTSIS